MADALILRTGGGGGLYDDLTATADKVVEGYTAITSDSDGDPIVGTFGSDATIGSNNQLLKSVVAYGRYGTKYEGTIESQGSLIYTPSTSKQIADVNGKYMTGNIVINPIPSNYKDTNGLTLDSAARMLSGYTAIGKNGVKYAGNIASQGALTYTPSTSKQTASVSGKYMTGDITINPIPSNYKDTNGLTLDSAARMLSGYKAIGKNGVAYTGNIASMAGVTVTPYFGSDQTIATSGKYMTSDIKVNRVNLVNKYWDVGDDPLEQHYKNASYFVLERIRYNAMSVTDNQNTGLTTVSIDVSNDDDPYYTFDYFVYAWGTCNDGNDHPDSCSRHLVAISRRMNVDPEVCFIGIENAPSEGVLTAKFIGSANKLQITYTPPMIKYNNNIRIGGYIARTEKYLRSQVLD